MVHKHIEYLYKNMSMPISDGIIFSGIITIHTVGSARSTVLRMQCSVVPGLHSPTFPKFSEIDRAFPKVFPKDHA